LIKCDRQRSGLPTGADAQPGDSGQDWLPAFVELLRTRTAHDFTLYKPGTLRRRIERRMAMASIEPAGADRYLDLVRREPTELALLAKDLLINVTSFFRDPAVFEFLAERVIPDLIQGRTSDQTIRVWIAGCSTGEEAYSLAMLFREATATASSSAKVQILASDVDPDAIASAREGLYPSTIAAEVSAARLGQFFLEEEHGFRVRPELRSMVVFTVQDILNDPPFARLDMISCRNLLIYLGVEAQAHIVSLFHFALREGGILLLGNAETVGNADGRFEVVSKQERLYRHIGRSRPGAFGLSRSFGDGVRVPPRPGQGQASTRQNTLGELCRRLVLEAFALRRY
jgi:two-component system CheB/CheR fusion protein